MASLRVAPELKGEIAGHLISDWKSGEDQPKMPASGLQMIESNTPFQKTKWATSVAFACVIFTGFALRVSLAIAFPNIYHYDEVFQVLEPAHRLATGWGVVTWEWRAGIRSWLVPGMLAGLMSLAGGGDAKPEAYLILITIVLSLASLSIVAIASLAGRRVNGAEGLAIAGAVSAGWYDLVYFGPKPLTEAIAANALVVAVYLATCVSADGISVSRRRWLLELLGCLLGLTFWLRFHLAPALPFIAWWACRDRVRERWLPLIAGAVIPLTVFGITDWLTLGTPFQSVWKNIWINIVEERSSTYGTAPTFWYASTLVRWPLLPITAAAVAGARRLPLFALVPAIIIVSMSVVPHKDIRFIFPAISLLVVLAGVGTALIVRRLRPLLWPAGPLWLPSGLAILVWLFTSTMITTRAVESGLHGIRPNVIRAETYLHERQGMCGLGLLGIRWYNTSGYTRLNQPIPITQLEPIDFLGHGSSVNWLLASADLISTREMKALLDRNDISKFATLKCWSEVCVMHRDGACTPMNGWDINMQLAAPNN